MSYSPRTRKNGKRRRSQKKRREYPKNIRRKPKMKKVCKICDKEFEAYDKKEICSSRCFGRRDSLVQFGITLEEWKKKMVAQNFACEICGASFKDVENCIDHNHATGAVRGLLCKKCNIGIGFMKESIPNLLNAISYIRKYNEA